MRIVLAAVSLLLAGVCHAKETKPARHVDLNRPGVLERLAIDNPRHHARIVEVIDVMQRKSCREALELTRVMQGFFVQCRPHLLKTSLPPKRHLSIHIDGVHYAGNVPVPVRAEVVPAR